MASRRNHSWNGHTCRRCRCSRAAVCWVNRFILWTYVRIDGIRFTGPSAGMFEISNFRFQIGEKMAKKTHLKALRAAKKTAEDAINTAIDQLVRETGIQTEEVKIGSLDWPYNDSGDQYASVSLSLTINYSE
ncbi:MAG TPA: hypothetical protein VGO43_08245 [Pyrinomonadaceae bacterium]|jgi:hypothetical protein|nr:hypothetical protein [Pyrinomonadaceae bacterium]